MTSVGMALVPVAEAELPELAHFVNAAYRGDSARRGWTHEADLLGGQRTDPETLRTELAGHPGAALLAWREGPAAELLGCVWLEPGGGGVWNLGMLTVRPDRQGSGLGRRLLAAAEAYAAERGARGVRMTVITLRESLIAWYGRRGYAPTGAREPFPYGEVRFGLPARDDLEFAVLEKRL